MRTLPACLLAVACATGIEVHDKPPTRETGAPTGVGDSAASGPNEPPVADAGPDLVGMVPDEITLDGIASYDPDGDVLNYEWVLLEQPSGSTALLINALRSDASLYPDRPGTYVAELTVDDGVYADSDEVTIEVGLDNDTPVANAGPDQSVDAGDRVVLNGSASFDPDGDPLQMSWTLISVPPGSSAQLDDPTSVLPQFTADQVGTYIVELIVSDGNTPSAFADQVMVVAQDPGDSDCLSCATAQSELSRRWSAGNASSALGLVLLPWLLLLYQRQRA